MKNSTRSQRNRNIRNLNTVRPNPRLQIKLRDLSSYESHVWSLIWIHVHAFQCDTCQFLSYVQGKGVFQSPVHPHPQLSLYATIAAVHGDPRRLDHRRPKKFARFLVKFKLQWLLPGQELQHDHSESVYIRLLSRNAGGLKFRRHVPPHALELPGSRRGRRKFLLYLKDFA